MFNEMGPFSLPKACDKEVMTMQVIRTTNKLAGQGTELSPYRRVTQYWTLDGDLLAEVDPFHPTSGAVE